MQLAYASLACPGFSTSTEAHAQGLRANESDRPFWQGKGLHKQVATRAAFCYTTYHWLGFIGELG
jgi:hypothetical protein